MALNLSSLQKAIDTLQRSINAAQEGAESLDADVLEAVKAGVIQHFEVTYELCWKFILRWIKENRSSEDAENPVTRKEIFRQAARYGLIGSPESWFVYGDARNLTSHTYNQSQAVSVYNTAMGFLDDAKYLLEKLKTSND